MSMSLKRPLSDYPEQQKKKKNKKKKNIEQYFSINGTCAQGYAASVIARVNRNKEKKRTSDVYVKGRLPGPIIFSIKQKVFN